MPANKPWKQYNESLVSRGTCLIDVSFLKKQRQELEKMNRNKIGAPYKCTDSQIGLLTGLYRVWHRLQNGSGSMQGTLRGCEDPPRFISRKSEEECYSCGRKLAIRIRRMPLAWPLTLRDCPSQTTEPVWSTNGRGRDANMPDCAHQLI